MNLIRTQIYFNVAGIAGLAYRIIYDYIYRVMNKDGTQNNL